MFRTKLRLGGRVFSLTVLGSGSSGNSALIATDNCRILVDIGFSSRQICQRLQAVDVSPEIIDAVILTHEHGDHVCGLEVFCRKYQVPIYCNSGTAEALRTNWLADYPHWHLFGTGSAFILKDIEVRSFYVPHDAIDPVAFTFLSNEGSIGLITDLGYAPKLALERIRDVHTLVIETNHNEKLLQDSQRPWSVKQRILSRHGHLSNEAAARSVAAIGGDQLRRVILGHLSRDCNRPDVALEAMHRIGRTGIDFHCAEQDKVSPVFVIEPRLLMEEQVKPVYENGHCHQYSQGSFEFLGWNFV